MKIPMIVEINPKNNMLRSKGPGMCYDTLKKLKESFVNTFKNYEIQFVSSELIKDVSVGEKGTIVRLTVDTNNIEELITKLNDISNKEE